jgi:hypothetical protein
MNATFEDLSPNVSSRPTIVDADVHPLFSPYDPAHAAYLPQRWRDYLAMRVLSYGADMQIVTQRQYAHRTDSEPPGGGAPGSDPAFAASQLLDGHRIAAAVLNNLGINHAIAGPRPYELGVALVRANNDWIRERWLDSDLRWYATVGVDPDHPAEAAAEIHRCAAMGTRFVGVYLPSRTEQPIGNHRYWPVFEAAVERGFPLVFHTSACKTSQLTASGMPSYYFEHHVLYAQHVYSLVPSLIFEGVFDRFPTLRIVLAELGWSWVAPFAGRLDASWRVLRDEVPHLRRAPSEYLRDHFWFTTQPVDEPPDPAWVGRLLEQLDEVGLSDHLMYSSDYPHWDFDSPDAIFSPRVMSADRRRAVLGASAAALYGIELAAQS